MERLFSRIFWILAICLFLASLGMAQTTTATLSGVLTDETGAVLPGAQVTVSNTATGLRRTVTTDAAGRFMASQLPPGPYEVIATLAGFEGLRRSGITLAVGQEAVLNLSMKVGAVTEQVTITGEAPLVNTASSSVSGVVEEKRIEELPLNGRDFSQLPLIQPGVAAIRNGDSTVSKGYGTRIAMGGSRPDQTAWLLDGTNIHNLSNFGTPASSAGVMLGVDAVREFQVLTSNYSAELGGTSGGVVNMVSKSGTNNLHGTAYEFLRNSALDARNFFDRDKPAFKRNQFGGSLGGPIRKDKAFFFGNYEGLRQRQQITLSPVVPDANVHQGLLPDGRGGLQQVQVSPVVRPYLNLWPLPNGGNLLDKNGFTSGLGSLFATASSPVDENFIVARGDIHLTDKQSLFSRFTFDQGTLTAPDSVPIFSKEVGTHARYVTLQHDYIISGTFLMTSRLAFNRTLLLGNETPLITYPASLNIFFPGWLPQFMLPGATAMGPNGQNWLNRVQNLWDFNESFQIIHGGHSIKYGFEGQRVDSTKNGEVAGNAGQFTWDTLQGFLTDGRLSAFTAVADGSARSRTWLQYFYGLYFQDDWKMRPNFTWNLGIRYEPFTSPTEKHHRVAMVRDWVPDTIFHTDIGLFRNPSKKNFSPRVGFAWDPKGDGKTAVRAGFGLFFVDINGSYYITPGGKNPPYFAAVPAAVGSGTLGTSASDMHQISPTLLTPAMTPNTFMEIIQWDLNPSYEAKFNLTVERQLPGRVSLSVGYLGDRGIHLWRDSDANDAPPILVNGRPFVVAGTPRLNRNVSVGTIRYSDAQSFYNGLQVELKKSFSHSFQIQSSYTWSKNVDDSTTGVALTDFTPGGNGNTSQGYNPKADRGLSSLHVGQTFVMNGIYSLPSPVTSGPLSAVVGGWQMAAILTANSGAPFSVYVSGRNAPDQSRSAGVQHPDLVAGRSFSSMVRANPNEYFDPKAFVLPPAGFFGNAGRNILLGPGLVNFDFSVMKRTRVPISESGNLEFHADFFNLFNRANFGTPSSLQVLNPANGQYIAGAGRISNTVTNSRQMQFGLKLIF